MLANGKDIWSVVVVKIVAVELDRWNIKYFGDRRTICTESYDEKLNMYEKSCANYVGALNIVRTYVHWSHGRKSACHATVEMSIYQSNITVTMAFDQGWIFKLQHVVWRLWLIQSLYYISLELMLTGRMVGKAFFTFTFMKIHAIKAISRWQ